MSSPAPANVAPLFAAQPEARPAGAAHPGDVAEGRTVLQAGDAVALDDIHAGYAVVSGKVELYAVLHSDDGGISGRHFLFEVGAGELIMPLGVETGRLRLIALAVEPTELDPQSADDLAAQRPVEAERKAFAASLDGWIGRIAAAVARLVGPPPTEAIAVNPGETIEAKPGDTLTARADPIWLAGSTGPLTYCGPHPPALLDVEHGAVVASGAWVAASSPGPINADATLSVLERSEWPRVLAEFHRCMFALIDERLRKREELAREAVETRIARTRRTLDRAFARFDSVLGQLQQQEAPEYTADEPFVAPLATVAAQLGISFTTQQRDKLARCRTIDEAARTVRLRNRTIALRGDWLRQDLGPLVAFLDEERRPVALIRVGGSWRIVESEGAKPLPLDRKTAARLGPLAHMLYQPFADKPLGFRDFVGFGWPRNRRDLWVAVAMSLAGALLGLATPFAMQLAFDRFIPGHQTLSLTELALGLVLAAVIAAAFRIAYDLSFLRIEGRSAAAVMAATMDRVLRVPDYALRMSPGDLASRISSADGLRRSVWGLLLGSIAALFFLVTNIGAMFYYSPAAAGVAIGIFATLALLGAYCGYRQLDELKHGEQILADVHSIVFQFVQGITALRATGAEDRAFARWAADFGELRARSYRARRSSILLETGLAALELLALAGILVVLAFMPRGNLSTGAFVSFIAAYGAYMGASLQLTRAVVGVWNARPSWDRTAPLLRAVPEGAGSKRDPGQLSGTIELTGVYFRYGPEAPFALQGVSLSIAPGEFIALVGPSGSGKSTLIRLLLGFDMPLSGAVQYDHQDLRFLDLELVRRQIGVVLQNSTLFPGTLYENIMGVFDGTMDDAWEAARQAGIEADIRAMPMGMHTVVTEASTSFSGGQVQRFAIARALVAKPRILLLDEATSAIDNATQAIVTAALERMAVTRVVIAHRLSTVKNADRIVVLDQGKVAQTGRFDQLAAAPGLFAELVRRQLI